MLAFEYRLAPEHPFPAPLEDAMKAWDHLMHLGYGARDVTVAGDSAGGNLALVLTLLLRDAGRILPRALVLLSPWTDMTASGPSYQERRELDPMLPWTTSRPSGPPTPPAVSGISPPSPPSSGT